MRFHDALICTTNEPWNHNFYIPKWNPPFGFPDQKRSVQTSRETTIFTFQNETRRLVSQTRKGRKIKEISESEINYWKPKTT